MRLESYQQDTTVVYLDESPSEQVSACRTTPLQLPLPLDHPSPSLPRSTRRGRLIRERITCFSFHDRAEKFTLELLIHTELLNEKRSCQSAGSKEVIRTNTERKSYKYSLRARVRFGSSSTMVAGRRCSARSHVRWNPEGRTR